MTDKKRKITSGLYEFKGFRIRRNVLKEYGYPSDAWIVSDRSSDELGPVWRLKDAIQWIKEMLR